MPEKVRPQNTTAADNSKLPAAILLTIGCDCQCNTCPSGHMLFTTKYVPTTEVSNLTYPLALQHYKFKVLYPIIHCNILLLYYITILWIV